MEEFRDTHLLEIRNLSENATEVLWDNFSESEQFETEIDPVSKYTNLSDGILSSLRVEDQNKEENNIRGAAVLISDGGHNQENSPLQTAKLLAVRNLPIYTVGLGSDQKPLDLALLQTVVPDSVYQEDRIKGIISIKDNLTPGTAYSIRINDSEGLNVWEKSMVGMDVGIGQIAFDFPAKKIVEQRLADFPESEKEAIRTIPLSFKIEVEPIENEAETENNQLTFQSTLVVEKIKCSLWIIGRGGKRGILTIFSNGMIAGKLRVFWENPIRMNKYYREVKKLMNFQFPKKNYLSLT